jgi:diguanylate cyclase
MYIRTRHSRLSDERGLLGGMLTSEVPAEPDDTRRRNLLLQEMRETLERARLGGMFYPIAAALVFLVTNREFVLEAIAITAFFAAIAIIRLCLRVSENPGEVEIRRRLRLVWFIVLTTTFAWGAFSAWTFTRLPEPAPLVAVLFSGAFGMALAHSLCMRRLQSATAIGLVMLPSLFLLWHGVAAGVGLMWLVYLSYMLLVLNRSHDEYHLRLALEEDLRQQRDLFEKQSLLDSLTGIANRRAFADALASALLRAQQGGRAALLILDIDHFKRVNDSFGHVAGDACLSALAMRLQQHFNHAGDIVARLGGEEFGVVLDCDGDTAFRRAEDFRSDLESQPLTFDAKQADITVSIGCGMFVPARHADADAFYLEVDTALYRSKLSGRNRTELAQAETKPDPADIASAG